MFLILAACRNTGWAERHLRSGAWAGASLLDMFGVDVSGRTLGSATVGTRIRMGERVLANIEIFLTERRAPDLIDRRNDVPRLQHAAT
jgi:lactate dehydrogenase-like 2-hydroxyacid dehydrogenase